MKTEPLNLKEIYRMKRYLLNRAFKQYFDTIFDNLDEDECFELATAYQTLINDYTNITEEQLEMLHKSINN
jgi:hypothetical protein